MDSVSIGWHGMNGKRSIEKKHRNATDGDQTNMNSTENSFT